MLSTLEEAIAIIKAGDKKTGRELLANIIQADLENELAWLWLSGVVETDEERRKCLKQVLEINPDNRAARRGLGRLSEEQGDPPSPSKSQIKPGGSLASRISTRQQQQPEPPKPVVVPQPDVSPEDVPASQTEPFEPVSELLLADRLEQFDQSPVETTVPPAELEIDPPEEQAEPEEPSQPEASPDLDVAVQEEEEYVEPEPSLEDKILTAYHQIEPLLPAPVQAALKRLIEYWGTDRGQVVIAGGLVGLLLLCAACVISGLVLRPVVEPIPATVAAVLGTETPTPTFTPTSTPTSTITPTPTDTPTLTPTPTSTQVVFDTPTPTPTPSKTPTPDPNVQNGIVVEVVSGDVIDVLIDEVGYRVKYLLIEAPVIDDPEKGTEPFGQEALEINRLLVEGQSVRLVKDVSETDDLGRLLRYVYVGDLLVNEELVRQGVARVSPVPPDLKFLNDFREVEEVTKAIGVGIWSVQ